MTRPNFPVVWQRIREHAGEMFETKRGMKFSYALEGDGFFPEGRNQRIDISDLEKAFGNVPCEGPSHISYGFREIRGTSYVWAVLHDRRIRRQDW